MPMIRTWRRLEPRSRAEQSDPAAWTEALRARVHDPAWMLARQLQVGEFEGEDAGSAVIADLRFVATPLDRFVLGARTDAGRSTPPHSLNGAGAPLECLVEREPIPMSDDGRVRLGRYFEAQLSDATLTDFARIVFPLHRSSSDDPIFLQQSDQAVRFRDAVAGRVVDGGAVFSRLEAGANGAQAYEAARAQSTQPPDDSPIRSAGALTADAESRLNDAAAALLVWYRRLHPPLPAGESVSWDDSRLEYNFSVSVSDASGRERVLDASEYYQGELDWYSFTVAPPPVSLGPRAADDVVPAALAERVIVIPAPVEFAGMPSPRWWDFEDRQVNFGSVDVHKTELAKLLVLEFAISQSVDWHLISVSTTAGSILQVESLDIYDNFGGSYRIGPAADPAEDWSLFSLSRHPRPASGPDFEPNLLFLPPALPHVQESAEMEEVVFLRDEMANMVWAVERTVSDDFGRSVAGHELAMLASRRRSARAVGPTQRVIDEWKYASDYLAEIRQQKAPSPELLRRAEDAESVARTARDREVARYVAAGGDLRDLRDVARPAEVVSTVPQYQLYSSMPANWIPFVPVPLPGQPGQMRLQRYAMPDLESVESGTPGRIRARGRVLKPEKRPFYVFEEEVPRGGARVVRTKQFVRDMDGRAHFWIGRRTRSGKGEGSSGLRFDFLQPR